MDDLFNNDALPVHVGIIMDGNGRWQKSGIYSEPTATQKA